MNTKLFVSSLSYKITDQDLEGIFAAVGQVKNGSAKVIQNRETGDSRGFGFIEMETQAEAEKAIHLLNGSDQMGRTITVSIAKAFEERNKNNRFMSSPRNRSSY